MNPLVKLLILALFAPALCAFAQQAGTKPVISAPRPAQTPSTPNTASGPASMPAGSGVSSSNYVISTGDTISILVWKEPGHSNANVPVRPDGMISLPLLGDLQAAGFTPTQLGDSIAEKLKKYVTDPRVTVTVLTIQAKEVYLLGEVGHVGPIAITPSMSPLQAIAAAGGLSPFAKAKQIYILRTENGQKKKIKFDYKKAIKDGDQQGVTLIPGDTIVVP